MMKLRLGFFPKFKLGDTVLLTVGSSDVPRLSALLKEFAASSEPDLPIHKLCAVSARYPAQLFASRITHGAGTGFRWPCSDTEIPAVEEKLEALSAVDVGHQYFELIESPAQFVVSVGEYDESWWQRRG